MEVKFAKKYTQYLFDRFITEHRSECNDLHNIVSNEAVSVELIEKILKWNEGTEHSSSTFRAASYNPNITLEFIEKYKSENLNWAYLIRSKVVTFEFIF